MRDIRISDKELSLIRNLGVLVLFLIGLLILTVYSSMDSQIKAFFSSPQYSKEELAKMTEERIRIQQDDWDRVENGVHVKTGMKFDKNFKHIRSSCLSCHSPKLISQNRATREGWKQMIKWMQESQGLQDLGDKEMFILDYLEKNYAPEESGRRTNLDIEAIEWYVLELD